MYSKSIMFSARVVDVQFFFFFFLFQSKGTSGQELGLCLDYQEGYRRISTIIDLLIPAVM